MRPALRSPRGPRFHDLRHQAITETAEAGASDATLMAVAGQMSRRMLERASQSTSQPLPPTIPSVRIYLK